MKQLSTTQIQTVSGGVPYKNIILAISLGLNVCNPVVRNPILAGTSAGFSAGYAKFKKEWLGYSQANYLTFNSWANHQISPTPSIDTCLVENCQISS